MEPAFVFVNKLSVTASPIHNHNPILWAVVLDTRFAVTTWRPPGVALSWWSLWREFQPLDAPETMPAGACRQEIGLDDDGQNDPRCLFAVQLTYQREAINEEGAA